MGPLESAITEFLIKAAEASLDAGEEITAEDRAEMERLMNEARELDEEMKDVK